MLIKKSVIDKYGISLKQVCYLICLVRWRYFNYGEFVQCLTNYGITTSNSTSNPLSLYSSGINVCLAEKSTFALGFEKRDSLE